MCSWIYHLFSILFRFDLGVRFLWCFFLFPLRRILISTSKIKVVSSGIAIPNLYGGLKLKESFELLAELSLESSRECGNNGVHDQLNSARLSVLFKRWFYQCITLRNRQTSNDDLLFSLSMSSNF